MRSVILPAQSDARHPLVGEASVLAGADVGGVVDPAREGVIVERAASTFKPHKDAGASRLQKLELNGAPGLPLDDDRLGANPTTADEVADSDLDDVTAAELAVDREIKHRSVAEPPFAIEPEPDRPHLLRFQCALCAELPTCVPRRPGSHARIILGMSHDPSPRQLMLAWK